jgi:4-coumarate--CoA ligase
MPIKSRWSLDIPNQSVPTWLFGSPDKPISNEKSLIDAEHPDTRYLTLSGYRLWAKRFAAGLLKAGLQTGDRVLIYSGNSMFYPVAWMGIVMAGGIATGANPTYVAREVAYQLTDTEAKFMLVADGSLEVGLEAASISGIGKERVFIFDADILEGTGKERLGVQNWSKLVASVQDGEQFHWTDPKSPKDTTCCLNYSSGTTGVPKGVEITHLNFVANSEQVIFASKLHPDYEYRTKTSRWICFLPLYHAYGQTYFLLNGPKRGIPIFIMQKFDFELMLEVVQKQRITQLTLVPPIAIAIAKSPLTKKYDLSSVRTMGSGAAPLSRGVSQEVEDIVGNGTNLKVGPPTAIIALYPETNKLIARMGNDGNHMFSYGLGSNAHLQKRICWRAQCQL